MRLLLDTHVLLAIINRRIDFLDAELRRAVVGPSSDLAGSVVSLWEIAIKFRLGKLPKSRLIGFRWSSSNRRSKCYR